ncbi:hypothetical protein ACFSN5_04645 [Streptococcus tangpeifui]|uniref:hypothetical protein n=1 Tax=Streptococcus tangpeifui TaxID=2709400 RepID=UPI0013EA1536|nr:hypothetical protein [Streptococcus sp. ZJ1593]
MNTNTKTKTLATINGIVGLVAGIFLLFAILFIIGAAGAEVESDVPTVTILVTIFIYIVKLAVLILGIVGAVYYKDDNRVSAAPSVLLIVGGAISLIPFFGWIGGILAIIGGSIYLASLKNFNLPTSGQF